jgi:hypothetical protein
MRGTCAAKPVFAARGETALPRRTRPSKPVAPQPERPPRFSIWVHRVDEPDKSAEPTDGDGPRPRSTIVITLLIAGSVAA